MALRIKKDIDLKELEKFGFWKWENYYLYDTTHTPVHMIDEGDISIRTDNKTITIDTYCEDLDILYDLIKADMVVKVDE